MAPPRLDRLEERRLPGGLRLYVARSRWARAVGLMGLRELPPACALLIPGCDSVHTFWVRFAIDLLFLDPRGEVARTVTGLPPCRVATHRGAAAVVETRAGEGAAFGALAGLL